MSTILVVDDEESILELATLYLKQDGFSVLPARSGEEALELARNSKPDLVVLDIMLPGINGFEVCRRLRESEEIPIIMLTARSEDPDKVVGLELGADDYITKPFSPRELSARVKAVLRRYSPGETRTKSIVVGDVMVDLGKRTAAIGGEPLDLRPKEFDLLASMARHLDTVLTREQLLEMVWGFDFYGESRTVDVHVARLRDKIAHSRLALETVQGVGYRLKVRE